MIVADTSALYAILANEPEAGDFARAISRDDAPQISALTLYETMIVCYARGGKALLEDLQQLLTTGNIAVVPFDRQAVNAAQAAYQQFGKGYPPPASTSATVQLTVLPLHLAARCFTKATISPKPALVQPCHSSARNRNPTLPDESPRPRGRRGQGPRRRPTST